MYVSLQTFAFPKTRHLEVSRTAEILHIEHTYILTCRRTLTRPPGHAMEYAGAWYQLTPAVCADTGQADHVGFWILTP